MRHFYRSDVDQVDNQRIDGFFFRPGDAQQDEWKRIGLQNQILQAQEEGVGKEVYYVLR